MIVSASDLRRADWIPGESATPYCVCEVPGKPESAFCTRVATNTLNPVWKHEQVMPEWTVGDNLRFSVYDKDWGKDDDLLGVLELEAHQFVDGIDGEFELTSTGKHDSSF